MALENEFRPKEEPVEEKSTKKVRYTTGDVEDEPAGKSTKSSKAKNIKIDAAPLKGLTSRFDKKRTKTIIGILMVLFSFFAFLSCVSYFFTWQADQDRVLNQTLFAFLFDENPDPVENWVGKFGAWMSHLFMYRWFGISSFAISFCVFLIGFKWMWNIRLLPIKRSIAVSSLFMVWTSIFLAYLAQHIDYLGGTFGYTVVGWLKLAVGSFGAFLVILGLLWITIVVLFNADISSWFRKMKSGEDEMEEEPVVQDSVGDIHVVNTIKDEDILQDQESEIISFDEDEEEDDGYVSHDDEEDSFVVIHQDVEKNEEELDIPIPPVVTPVTGVPGLDLEGFDEGDFAVSIAKSEGELSEEELHNRQAEYGDYDPTLDLSSYVLPPIDLLKEYGKGQVSIDKQELEDNKNKIVETLSHYKIDIAKIKATVGPTVTLYEIVPAPGVRISKIKNLEDDIALSLSALGIRIIAPIPGKGTIGIEVPNSKPDMVSMRSLIASEKFQNSDMELPV